MAVGAAYLAKKKAIVQKLTAIESLAGVDILCSDKTGTLTANKLSVHSRELPHRTRPHSLTRARSVRGGGRRPELDARRRGARVVAQHQGARPDRPRDDRRAQGLPRGARDPAQGLDDAQVHAFQRRQQAHHCRGRVRRQEIRLCQGRAQRVRRRFLLSFGGAG